MTAPGTATMAKLREAWEHASEAYADTLIIFVETMIRDLFPGAVSYTTEGDWEQIGADLSVSLVGVTLADGTVIGEGGTKAQLKMLETLADSIRNDLWLDTAVRIASLEDDWSDIQEHSL